MKTRLKLPNERDHYQTVWGFLKHPYLPSPSRPIVLHSVAPTALAHALPNASTLIVRRRTSNSETRDCVIHYYKDKLPGHTPFFVKEPTRGGICEEFVPIIGLGHVTHFPSLEKKVRGIPPSRRPAGESSAEHEGPLQHSTNGFTVANCVHIPSMCDCCMVQIIIHRKCAHIGKGRLNGRSKMSTPQYTVRTACLFFPFPSVILYGYPGKFVLDRSRVPVP